MKLLSFTLPLALVAIGAAPAFAQDSSARPAATQAQTSYALGLNMGSGLRTNGVVIDPEAFLKGVQDAIADRKPALSPDEMKAALSQLQADVQAYRVQKLAQAAAANKAQGEAFLKANGAKPGVTTLPSGLQYQVLTAGAGGKPKPSDTVLCNYRGVLIDGTEFDSSASHGGPASLRVDSVIAGWSEALQLMPTGSKWRLFVPSALAYGERGAGSDIGPDATLIFDIELLSVVKN